MTRVKENRSDLVAKAIVPDYALGSHHRFAWADLRKRRAIGTPTLPAGLSSASTVHGIANTFNGYRVVFVPFRDGMPSGMARDVVMGFLSQDGNAYGRPVGGGYRQGGWPVGRRRCRQCRVASVEIARLHQGSAYTTRLSPTGGCAQKNRRSPPRRHYCLPSLP